MKNSLIIIPFNVLLGDICDYAEQTIRILAKDNQVMGVALGNPLSLFRDFGTIIRGRFLIRHWGISILLPIMVVPFQRFKPLKRLNLLLNIFALNLWLVRQKKQKLLWFFEPRYLSHFLNWLMVDVSLYDCVDSFSVYEDWRTEHTVCLKKASFVVANSRTLQRQLSRIRPDAKRVPLGFAFQDMPRKLKPFKKKQALIFGYIGEIGQRFDLQFLQQLLKRYPTSTFLFIGPQRFAASLEGRKKQRLFQQFLRRPNVQWIAQLPRKALWQKARQFDVGLVPYDVRHSFNRSSFPMKVMEYFYAGVPVIATNIQELSFYPQYVYQPARRGWQGLGKFLSGWTPRQQQRERTIALANTWQKKVEAIETYLAARMRRTNSQV